MVNELLLIVMDIIGWIVLIFDIISIGLYYYGLYYYRLYYYRIVLVWIVLIGSPNYHAHKFSNAGVVGATANIGSRFDSCASNVADGTSAGG